MAARINDDMRQRHLKLLNHLADYFDPELDKQEYDKFINSCRVHLPPIAVKKSPNLIEALKNLERKGVVAIGKYDKLKTIVEDLDATLSDDIKEAEEDIARFQQQASASGAGQLLRDDAGPPSNRVTNLNVPNMSSAGSAPQHQPIGSTDVPSTPKRRRDDLVDDYCYKVDNKKGFLVMLNFTQYRAGTLKDQERLKDFFEDDLHWDVEIRKDLTYDKIDRYLNGLQERLDEDARKYYCLVVVIMSHGTKEGIYPHDSKKEVPEKQVYDYDRIFNFFKNDQIKAFADKPKVFLVQACRGNQIQREVIQQDDQPMEEEPTEKSTVPPAVRISIPVDAHVLIMWATTPGNKAFRDPYLGSHFLQEVVEQFKHNHETDHLETMLMRVRYIFAHTKKYYQEEQVQNDEGSWVANVQMPCSWTTLTKCLYLTRHQ